VGKDKCVRIVFIQCPKNPADVQAQDRE